MSSGKSQQAPPQTATPESVRAVNRAILLGLARRYEPLSRAELSRRSGIFPSNVSRIVEDLVGEGLLAEERGVAAGRGKVPAMLRIRDGFYSVIGIYMQPALTTVASAGFRGEIQKTWQIPTPSEPAAFIREASQLIAAIGRELPPGAGEIRHIGVGVPGFVDAVEGRITCVTTMPNYSQFHLAAELQRATGIPVSLDNDCNLGALSELRRAECRADGAPGDFLFLSVGDYGVGAGMILGGELYRGHDSRFAAEVGHLIVNPEGPQCTCGRHGCLETYIANAATWRRYKPRTPFSRARFHDLLQTAADGEPKAVAAIEETARCIALVASNLVSVLNPAEVVLAGEIGEAFPMVRDALDKLYDSPYAHVTMRRSWLPRETPLVHGAVCLALDGAMPAPAFAPSARHANIGTQPEAPPA
jgi:N-acetylglucosamine repressor